MFLMPRAEFWRVWVVAAMLVAVAIAAFTGMERAHGQTMRASFYDQGQRTASGDRFRPMGFTAAHRTIRFGARLRVCLIGCVVVTITDRGPALRTGRSLDLSRGAARAIGLERRGVALISVGVL